MKINPTIFSLISLIVIYGWACKETTSKENVKEQIQAVLEEQVQGWNEGNLEKFMQGYFQSDSTRFVSGGNVTYGWVTLLNRYKNHYPDTTTMGKLQFRGLDITVLSEDAALVFGKWQLKRQKDSPWGYFTLLFRKYASGWKIVHDHTSSAN